MASYGKRSLKDKFAAAGRKIAVTAALIVSAAVPAWYSYGTVHEQEVKITAIDKKVLVKEKAAPPPGEIVTYPDCYYDPNDYWCFNDESRAQRYTPPSLPPLSPAVYQYTMRTSTGEFRNEKTPLHLKSGADTKKIQDKLESGHTYRMKYYGVDFLGMHKNILSVTPLSDQEIQARTDAEKRAREELAAKNKAATPSTQQQKEGAKTIAGDEATFAVAVDGNVVTLKVPKSAADRIDVEKVRTITPQVTPPKPPSL